MDLSNLQKQQAIEWLSTQTFQGVIPLKKIYDDFLVWAKEQNIKYPITNRGFGKIIARTTLKKNSPTGTIYYF